MKGPKTDSGKWRSGRGWTALPLAFLFWFCQNPETESETILLTLEADAGFQQFSRLWVGFHFEGDTDTLTLFDDSLEHLEDLHKLAIPNRNSGKGSVVFRGFEGSDGRLVYSEIRVIGLAEGNLISAETRLDLRSAQVPATPGAPTVDFTVRDTSVSIGDTLTLSAILADSAGNLRSYAWSFGGVQSFSAPLALDEAVDTVFGTHVFRDTGTFAVSLKVNNEQRRETLKSMTVRVLLDAPIAEASADSAVTTGDTLRLQGEGKDGFGRITAYAWKIGDGAFQASADGGASFAAPADPGTVIAVLRVTDDDGLSAFDTLRIAIRAGSSAYLEKLSPIEAALSAAFDRDSTAHATVVGNGVSELQVVLKAAHAGARIRVADRDLAPGDSIAEIGLEVGANPVPIRVTAQDGKTTRDYELTITRLRDDNATLKSLEPDPGRLVPDFSPSKFQYALLLENHQDQVKLTPTALDGPNTRIRVNNVVTATGSPSQTLAVKVGVDTIPVEVRAQDDSTVLVYRVIVTRKGSGDATLKDLKSSLGAFTPAFADSVRSYADTVAPGAAGVTLTPSANSGTARISLRGKTIASGQPSDSIPLAVGHTLVEVVVKAQNGDSLVYRVDFYRPSGEARLKGIEVSAGNLRPEFQPDRTDYADTVASTVVSIIVTAVAEAPVRGLDIQDSAIAGLSGSRKINLAVGDNVIAIAGVAEDGSRREYSLTVHRQSGNANLSAFGLAPDLPRMALQPSVLIYGDTVGFGVDSLRVMPAAAHAGATFRLNGIPLASGGSPARVGLRTGANSLLLKVIAEDTAITRTYTLNIWRRRGYVKAIGGANDETGSGIAVTADGGLAMTGSAYVSASQGLDAFLLKTDAAGDTVWAKTFGGSGGDGGNVVLQTPDRGFFVAGKTVPPGRTDLDLYWFKTDASGNKLWERNFGGSADDGVTGIGAQTTRDGGFIVCSQTESFGSGATDIYVLKTDGGGDTVWAKTFGGTGNDVAFSIQQTADDGFILVGRTQVASGDNNLFLVRLNASGDTSWTRTMGESGGAIGVSVAVAADKGFIITGQDESAGGGEALLVKTDSLGNVEWSETYGAGGADWGRSVLPAADGGYIVAGYTSSGYFGPNAGASDAFLMRVNPVGAPVWTRVYGGGEADQAAMVKQTADNGFIAVGTVKSSPPSQGLGDIFIIRTDASGNSD